jgi:hypothetical protein
MTFDEGFHVFFLMFTELCFYIYIRIIYIYILVMVKT